MAKTPVTAVLITAGGSLPLPVASPRRAMDPGLEILPIAGGRLPLPLVWDLFPRGLSPPVACHVLTRRPSSGPATFVPAKRAPAACAPAQVARTPVKACLTAAGGMVPLPLTSRR